MATRTDRSSSSALRREGIAAESGAIRNIAPTGVVCPCLKAVGWNEFGGPEALHVVGLPDPEAGPRELRIRVHWAAVNPTDTGLRSGGRAAQLKDIAPPHVPGMDAAGVLEQIGEGVSTELAVGEHVMAIVVPLEQRGAYSERIVVPADSVARVPRGATDVEAATLPMNGLTARLALDRTPRKPMSSS
jgi:NADPH:quinone reductase-like Zn-dependent oxidoreductase